MVKIDTKTNFRIFYLSGEELAENMAETLKEDLLSKRKEKPFHAIIVLPETGALSASFLSLIKEVQKVYFSEFLSFITVPVKNKLKKEFPVFKDIHHAPTLREGIDIVMMEKLERELFGPDE